MANETRPEIVIGLVGAAGARLHELGDRLRIELARYDYRVIQVRVSTLLERYTGWEKSSDTDALDRLRHLQTMGNAFRARAKDAAVAARAAISEIRKNRASVSGDPDTPVDACAYVIHQLKNPDEVDLLRETYGSSFVLIAGHATRRDRIAALAKRAALAAKKPGKEREFEPHATSVVNADDKQDDAFGQNTRDTYPKADFFADLGQPNGEFAVGRFIELVFGHPFHTPLPDEYAMYQASAVSFRSSDDSRQVGAVIVSLATQPHNHNIITNADVIAVGMNEVPRRGGGFYWENESPDGRDQYLVKLGDDRPREIKLSTLGELLERLEKKGWLKESTQPMDANELAESLLPDLKGTQFMNISEFGRPVHAEMAALIDAARRGVAVNGQTMYVTTFPCHNCAKHIIAAGIHRVVYLEPYLKSRTEVLYAEEVDLGEGAHAAQGKVLFRPFAGVGPRLYAQLFSMSARGVNRGRSLMHWENSLRELSPLTAQQDAYRLYLNRERRALASLDTAAFEWSPTDVCPSGE